MQVDAPEVSLEHNILDGMVEINDNYITNIISYAMSAARSKMVIATAYGIAIVNTQTAKYLRFEHEQSPFKSKLQDCGVRLCSILEERNEVALVPNFNSKKYQDTCVYIFDYKLESILYKNDFLLPIRQLALNSSHLMVSNQKRLIIYNYENDFEEKDEKYYLHMYTSTTENNRIRYFDMNCSEYEGNKQQCNCMCGKFVVANARNTGLKKYESCRKQPFSIVFLKIAVTNKNKTISMMLYDRKVDQETVLLTIPYEENFHFTISECGNLIAFSQDFGKRIAIYNTQDSYYHSTLWLSQEIRNTLNLTFITLPNHQLWLSATRQKLGGTATMHLFKIPIFQIKPAIIVKDATSLYKRYFDLFVRIIHDYSILHQQMPSIQGPDIFLKGNTLYCISLMGQICEIVDFVRTGNHQKKIIENTFSWEEQRLEAK